MVNGKCYKLKLIALVPYHRNVQSVLELCKKIGRTVDTCHAEKKKNGKYSVEEILEAIKILNEQN